MANVATLQAAPFADLRGKHEINGCRQFDRGPLGAAAGTVFRRLGLSRSWFWRGRVSPVPSSVARSRAAHMAIMGAASYYGGYYPAHSYYPAYGGYNWASNPRTRGR